MKKIILLLFTVLILGACNQTEDLNAPLENKEEVFTTVRSAEEAVSLAKIALSLFGDKSRSQKELSLSDVVVIPSQNASRNAVADTAIYAVNVGEDEGFVLIAAPRSCETPIIGVAENGTYSEEALNEDSGFAFYMESARQYAVTPIDTILKPIYREVPYYSLAGCVKHKTPEWGQYWPENIFCSNKVAGCVPVAVAELVTYHKPYKNLFFFSYENPDKSYQSFDWDKLSKVVSTSNKNPYQWEIEDYLEENNLTMEDALSLARLIREIGERAGCDYNPNSTGCTDYGKNVLKEILGSSLTYTEGSTADNLFELFYDDLVESKIGTAIIGGTSYLIFEDATIVRKSHSWVVDGYAAAGVLIKRYDWNTGELVGQVDQRVKYLHMNWGESGKYNGLFLTDAINPLKGYEDEYDMLIHGYKPKNEEYNWAYDMKFTTIFFTYIK